MLESAGSIYKTLAFFDAQDMPLTLLEIKTYLARSVFSPEMHIAKIEKVIETELKNIVDFHEGFYFLAGQAELISLRKTKYRVSLKNFRKAKRYLWPLRFFPFIRSVAISGSLALLNSTDKSDVDLFVITKINRIWLSRVLVSLYFQILGQRRYGIKISGRFCLNHYICEELILEGDRNLYTAVEYASLIPVVGEENVKRFWRQNTWIKDYLVSSVTLQTSPFFPLPYGRGGSGTKRFVELLSEIIFLGPLLNWLSGIYQKNRIKMQEHIIAEDLELSFHPGSRGQRVLEKFQRNLALPVK